MTRRRQNELSARANFVPLLLLGAAGCSLLIPLDYTGGSVGAGAGGKGSGGSAAIAGTVGQDGGVGGTTAAKGGSAGQVAGTGGVAGTGAGATGGTGEGGTGDVGTGDTGGAPNGGAGAEAGAGEGGESQGGSAGSAAGTAGGGTAGGGMAGGGTAGGGMGGSAGSAGAGSGCAGARPNADPLSCGPCGVVCAEGDECIQGQCVASPCDKLCTTTITSVTLSPNQGYKQNNVAVDPLCLEVMGYEPASGTPSFVCWNMSGRAIQLNGVSKTMSCDTGGHPISAMLRKGGYCVTVTAGTNNSAGFEFPN